VDCEDHEQPSWLSSKSDLNSNWQRLHLREAERQEH
jgi:hypothetical protein